jgi:hypothetical protein
LLKKIYVGNKKDGILSTDRPTIDLMSSKGDELSIHHLEHGQGELFFLAMGDLKATKTSGTAMPSYFYFGKDVLDIKIQMYILQSAPVTGEGPISHFL